MSLFRDVACLLATLTSLDQAPHTHALQARHSEQPAEQEQRRLQVLGRMQWWVNLTDPKPVNEFYLFFTCDAGGPNNIRIGWEMSAVVAQRTNRTLVLPPASQMYLLDFGPRTNLHENGGKSETKVEDLIDLAQLKGMLPVLTADEFATRTNQSWDSAVESAASVASEDICQISAYNAITSRILYMPGNNPREGFSCSEWWERGGPRQNFKSQLNDDSWALLTHGFVWHPDAFTIASHAVSYLGIFNYSALHARYNDFQFKSARQGAGLIVDKWGKFLAGLNQSVYIASDEPDKFTEASSEIPGTRKVFFHELFGENGPPERQEAPLAEVRKQFSPERWFKMLGPAEELICTFGKVFIGTDRSTFSGHINRMRLHAQAPVTMVLKHTLDVPEKEIMASIAAWERNLTNGSDYGSNFHKHAVTAGDAFLQHSSEASPVRAA